MRMILLGLLSLACTASEKGQWGVEEEEDVVILTMKNFDEFIKNHKYVFVKFYAPWCGHCKSMAPAYSKVAKRFKVHENPIPIAKVDSTVETELGTRFGIKGFPTLKFFIEGTPIDYPGAREENPIFDWILKKTGPATKEVSDSTSFDKLMNDKLTIVYLLPKNAEALSIFETVAAGYEGIPFYFTHDESLKGKLKKTGTYTLAILKNFDEGHTTLSQSMMLPAEDIKDFIELHRYPHVMEFDQQAAERIFGGEHPAIIHFSEDFESKHAVDFKNAGKKFGRDILFSISKIKSDLGARLAEFIGITSKDEGANRIIKFSQGNLLKYKCTEDIEKCLNDFKEDRLIPYFKSEEAPTENTDPVKVVVGNTFKEIVLDSDKHVLIEAYAPWCGHCKKFAPIYEEAAKKLANHPDIVIAKMDGAANEYPGFDIQGFPTIKLYRRGHKTEPIDFGENRTLEGIIKFLETETGLTLKKDGGDSEL